MPRRERGITGVGGVWCSWPKSMHPDMLQVLPLVLLCRRVVVLLDLSGVVYVRAGVPDGHCLGRRPRVGMAHMIPTWPRLDLT